MSNVTINQFPVASTIDGSLDILAIYTASVAATQGISRNTLLGIASGPLGLTDSQSMSNKTIGITNSITQQDGTFTLVNTSDNTKIGLFSLAGNTTSTTRTYTLPNITDTLVSLTATQTLTNKTLTSPAITSPTITNATITTDLITGYTSADTGTLYGISIASSQITSNMTMTGTLTVSSGFTLSSGTLTLPNNSIAAPMLSTTAITLSYIPITSSVTVTTPSSDTLVTGFTTGSITIPAGGRKVKITVWVNDLHNSGTNATTTLSIWDGTVGSGTELATGLNGSGTVATDNHQVTVMAIVTPAAGSKTYNVGVKATSGNAVVGSTVGSTTCAFILVEAI